MKYTRSSPGIARCTDSSRCPIHSVVEIVRNDSGPQDLYLLCKLLKYTYCFHFNYRTFIRPLSRVIDQPKQTTGGQIMICQSSAMPNHLPYVWAMIISHPNMFTRCPRCFNNTTTTVNRTLRSHARAGLLPGDPFDSKNLPEQSMISTT